MNLKFESYKNYLSIEINDLSLKIGKDNVYQKRYLEKFTMETFFNGIYLCIQQNHSFMENSMEF